MGILRKAGWEIDPDTGREVFLMVVEFQDEKDLPDIPISTVWNKNPVTVVLVPETK